MYTADDVKMLLKDRECLSEDLELCKIALRSLIKRYEKKDKKLTFDLVMKQLRRLLDEIE